MAVLFNNSTRCQHGALSAHGRWASVQGRYWGDVCAVQVCGVEKFKPNYDSSGLLPDNANSGSMEHSCGRYGCYRTVAKGKVATAQRAKIKYVNNENKMKMCDLFSAIHFIIQLSCHARTLSFPHAVPHAFASIKAACEDKVLHCMVTLHTTFTTVRLTVPQALACMKAAWEDKDFHCILYKESGTAIIGQTDEIQVSMRPKGFCQGSDLRTTMFHGLLRQPVQWGLMKDSKFFVTPHFKL